MKRIISLLTFSVLLSCTAWATHDDDHNGDDPDKPKKESQYSFSLSNSWFSLFNLFSVEEEKKDSLYIDEKQLELLVNPPK